MWHLYCLHPSWHGSSLLLPWFCWYVAAYLATLLPLIDHLNSVKHLAVWACMCILVHFVWPYCENGGPHINKCAITILENSTGWLFECILNAKVNEIFSNQLLLFFSLGLLLCNLCKERKLDFGQGNREAVKLDKRKIQSSKGGIKHLIGDYAKPLSLNWCDLRLDESLCWPNEFMALNHSPRFSSLYSAVTQISNNKPVLAPLCLARILSRLWTHSASQTQLASVGGVGNWARHPCLWTCCGCHANGF